eukprot:364954-Chlamydomonas_euryale.AAC.2
MRLCSVKCEDRDKHPGGIVFCMEAVVQAGGVEVRQPCLRIFPHAGPMPHLSFHTVPAVTPLSLGTSLLSTPPLCGHTRASAPASCIGAASHTFSVARLCPAGTLLRRTTSVHLRAIATRRASTHATTTRSTASGRSTSARCGTRRSLPSQVFPTGVPFRCPSKPGVPNRCPLPLSFHPPRPPSAGLVATQHRSSCLSFTANHLDLLPLLRTPPSVVQTQSAQHAGQPVLLPLLRTPPSVVQTQSAQHAGQPVLLPLLRTPPSIVQSQSTQHAGQPLLLLLLRTPPSGVPAHPAPSVSPSPLPPNCPVLPTPSSVPPQRLHPLPLPPPPPLIALFLPTLSGVPPQCLHPLPLPLPPPLIALFLPTPSGVPRGGETAASRKPQAAIAIPRARLLLTCAPHLRPTPGPRPAMCRKSTTWRSCSSRARRSSTLARACFVATPQWRYTARATSSVRLRRWDACLFTCSPLCPLTSSSTHLHRGKDACVCPSMTTLAKHAAAFLATPSAYKHNRWNI